MHEEPNVETSHSPLAAAVLGSATLQLENWLLQVPAYLRIVQTRHASIIRLVLLLLLCASAAAATGVTPPAAAAAAVAAAAALQLLPLLLPHKWTDFHQMNLHHYSRESSRGSRGSSSSSSSSTCCL
jgi:hypothetical protein